MSILLCVNLSCQEKGDNSMRVRSFQLSDASQVMELLQVALSEECYEDTKRAFARQLSWDSELIVVTEVDGEIVGALIGTIDQNLGCIYRVAVHPEYRRQGVGKNLVSAMEQRFQQRNVSRIMVAGDEHNLAAMPLYEAMGYAGRILEAFQKLGIAATHTLSRS
ncbi:Acetyltransferase YpeA [compost metagenome]